MGFGDNGNESLGDRFENCRIGDQGGTGGLEGDCEIAVDFGDDGPVGQGLAYYL